MGKAVLEWIKIDSRMAQSISYDSRTNSLDRHDIVLISVHVKLESCCFSSQKETPAKWCLHKWRSMTVPGSSLFFFRGIHVVSAKGACTHFNLERHVVHISITPRQKNKVSAALNKLAQNRRSIRCCATDSCSLPCSRSRFFGLVTASLRMAIRRREILVGDRDGGCMNAWTPGRASCTKQTKLRR